MSLWDILKASGSPSFVKFASNTVRVNNFH